MKNALKLLTILISLACWTTTAHAHTKILTSKPANGTVLTLPPSELALEFASEIRLAKVTLRIDDGKEIKLDLSEQKTFRTDFTFPIAFDDIGSFIVTWRGIGSDGHIRSGKLQFTVSSQ